ncbi:MAG: restriction endonuclease subunit S [Mariprofundaceae bacterium]|nr:restriction endonuclease subunit S [Mariprofundaceae bacterium]
MNDEGKSNSALITQHSAFNTPAIRFEGFGGEWKEKRAIEFCSISTGKNNTQDKIHEGKYPFYVRSATIERSNNYLFDEEAVLTVGDGVGTGKVYHYVNGKYDLHQRVYRMYDFNDITGKYFFYFFSNNFYKRVISMTAKTSVDSVRLEMIADMMINAPVIEEQTQIGNFFQQLDRLIAQHQQKHDKLRCVKKALLEKMFPKQGETQPAIRFKGFSEAWESKVLGSIVSFYKGKDLPKSSIQDGGVYPCIHYDELFTKYSEVIEVVTSRTNQNENLFSISNDVLMPTSDVTPKGLVKSCCVKQNGVVLGGDILVIRSNNQGVIDGAFLSRFIRTREQQVLQNVTGSTVFHLYASSIENLDIAFPSIEEQTKIGNLFQQLDTLITQQQTQLTQLANIKQSMLAKMFV